jgi:hypothetical protein
MVLGDVNGDGAYNDRAFIFDPAAASNESVANAMTTLLHNAPTSVRNCLRRQLGQIATRNSCAGPWTATLNAVVDIDLQRISLPKGSHATLSIANILGGVDQLLHGSHLRGWGTPATPDPFLLSITGFNPNTNAFTYAVNQRFGDTRASRSLARNPFQVTLQVQFPVGPSVDRQMFTQIISYVQNGHQYRRSESEILQDLMQGGRGLTLMIIALRDSVLLTTGQVDSLRAIERQHIPQLNAIWHPVAKWLSERPEHFDEQAALDTVQAARRRQGVILEQYITKIRSVLTSYQIDLLPPYVRNFLDPRAVTNGIN